MVDDTPSTTPRSRLPRSIEMLNAQLILGVTIESSPAGFGSFIITFDGTLVNAASVTSTRNYTKNE
jgi:hypothetical protein